MTKNTKQTIVLNGRRYDAHSGKPVTEPVKAAPIKTAAAAPTSTPAKKIVISDIAAAVPKRPVERSEVTAHAIHARTQKSTTLRREHVKKPVSLRAGNARKIHRAVERSQRISHFASNAPAETTKKSSHPDIDRELARQAEVIHKAHAHHIAAANIPAAKISSRAVKEHLLQKALAAAPSTASPAFEAGSISRRARWSSVVTTCVALVLLGGYLTYINIPNLSIRVAAANAGIDAQLPQYQPGGYRLHGPIAYSNGEVEIRYQENGGNGGYSIIQKSSDWDPTATLDNYVKPDSNDDYEIHSVQGLTVYTYGQKAVWVNGGILHILDANDELTGSTVERIAASM